MLAPTNGPNGPRKKNPVAEVPVPLRVVVGIGGYNEARTIRDVLAGFDAGMLDDVVVIDDGSTDETPEIVTEAGVALIRHSSNRGAGAAIKSLIRYGQDHAYDVIVLMAGNGKDDPREIPRLLEPILNSGYDYVQGSRYLRGGSSLNLPWQRALLIRMLALFYRLMTRFPSTDPSNGFRAYKLSVVSDPRINIWQDWLDDYGLEHYLNWLVLKLGFCVKEVPVSKHYPGQRGVRYTHVRPFVDWWRSVRPILYLVLGMRR
jgi:dolichol-phosphate mannosyltransferase